ncbi:MAG: hypothetical protein AAF466_09635 [Bacteroidota bacterium]
MKPSITCLIFCLLFQGNIFGQVGIGTTTPDPSAALEISAVAAGFLGPRIALSSTELNTLDGTNQAATGLLIYNTNNSITGSGASGEGYYYYDGSIWVKLAVAPEEKLYGEVYNVSDASAGITNNTALPFDTTGTNNGLTMAADGITTGRAGTYLVIYTVNIVKSGAGGGSHEIEFYLTQGGTEVPGTRTYADVSDNPVYVSATQITMVNLAANQKLEIRPDQSNSNVTILSGSSLSVELIDE